MGPNPTTRRDSWYWWSQASREKLHPCDPPEKVRAARLGTTPTNGGRGTQRPKTAGSRSTQPPPVSSQATCLPHRLTFLVSTRHPQLSFNP